MLDCCFIHNWCGQVAATGTGDGLEAFDVEFGGTAVVAGVVRLSVVVFVVVNAVTINSTFGVVVAHASPPP